MSTARKAELEAEQNALQSRLNAIKYEQEEIARAEKKAAWAAKRAAHKEAIEAREYNWVNNYSFEVLGARIVNLPGEALELEFSIKNEIKAELLLSEEEAKSLHTFLGSWFAKSSES